MTASTQMTLLGLVLGVAAAGIGLMSYYLMSVAALRRSSIGSLSALPTRREKRAKPGENGHHPGLPLPAADSRMEAGVSPARPAAPRETTSVKLYRAGYFSARDRRNFRIFQVGLVLLGAILPTYLIYLASHELYLSLGAALLALPVAFSLPHMYLDHKIEALQDEIRYYLPLVIEQISLAIGSSLVIGTAISHLVDTAESRKVYNPVVELFAHAQELMRTGKSLDEALRSVAELLAMPEVDHTFMFISQCARHGGEISKQLQELANATTTERHIRIQGKIQGLPVKATGPLGLVFAGFFFMVFSGLAVQILSSFGR